MLIAVLIRLAEKTTLLHLRKSDLQTNLQKKPEDKSEKARQRASITIS